MARPTYTLEHRSPTGVLIGTYTPGQARMPAFSAKVNPHGSCGNAALRIVSGANGIKAGDWLTLALDDGRGGGLVTRYAGEVRVAPGKTAKVSTDINLAGGMARLRTVEVREPRIPAAGTADSGMILKEAVFNNVAQTGTAISPSPEVISNTGIQTSLTPYFASLADVVQGVATAAGHVSGVDAQRRVFSKPATTLETVLSEGDAHVRVEAKQVSSENLCTAVRWVLGSADDGGILTYLSVSPAAATWGTHVNVAQLVDGLSYLKKMPHTEINLAPGSSPGAYLTMLSAQGWDPNTGASKVSYTIIVNSAEGDTGILTGRIAHDSGQPVDMVETRTYAPDHDQVTEVNAITAGEPVWRPGAVANSKRGRWSTLNGQYVVKAASATNDGSRKGIYMLDPVFYTIDRAALDQRAASMYRVPSSDPVTVHVHGRYLTPTPFVRLTRADGTVQVEPIAEVEYVGGIGWWGTIIHVGQRQDGIEEAVASSIANRDRDAQNAALRGAGTPVPA